ncbi:hypothetical protein PR202_gb03660 [Eleusine coracana subsp. coracana]|uniref:Box C/D snoRNA protein 1 n=1 Tax=Eleusine coracana subsp. coracana TaxID=191504 RepID=A0AAV5E2G0_ELECO|nr:hypothetical protein QOZ80_1BG0097430 [Eleusine coracana subsp. coracana]GJN16647.1 hypothetical protein PR202_gb03660 [Eleusine coracana subsp. coracana]
MEEDREDHGAEAKNADPNASSSSGGGCKKVSPCEECGEQPWKYRCPGCDRLTCSLPCVQAHKRRTACTGKRPRTAPVPLARFDDTQLLSDYNFLEETNQARESAHRLIAGFGGNFGGPGGAQMPPWLFFLRKAAQRRGIRLYFLPRGMARREQNRTRHNHRKNCISWTLEWRFSSTDIVLTDHEIDEHATLLSLLEKHLSPGPWKDQLTQYRNAELCDLKLFIQKSAKDSESPYRQLNVEEPLGKQLRGTLIVEYPTINVFLPSDNFDFEVEKTVNKLIKDEKPPDRTNDVPRPEGTEFHEEEIEEGEFAPDTQVIDLKDSGASQTNNLALVEIANESKIDNSVDLSALTANAAAPETMPSMKTKDKDTEETMGVGLASKVHDINLKEHGNSHPGKPAEAEGVTVSKMDAKTDSLVSSISILTPDSVNGPEQEHSEQSKRTPSTTPEALKRKSCAKVYPLDTEDNNGLLFPDDVPDLGFEQEMRDNYPELFGDMDTDDFFSYDIEMINGHDPVETMSALLWDDLEDGEIPSL